MHIWYLWCYVCMSWQNWRQHDSWPTHIEIGLCEEVRYGFIEYNETIQINNYRYTLTGNYCMKHACKYVPNECFYQVWQPKWRVTKDHQANFYLLSYLTFLSHICSGLLPILYRMDKNPLWNVFLNILANFNVYFGPNYHFNPELEWHLSSLIVSKLSSVERCVWNIFVYPWGGSLCGIILQDGKICRYILT